MQKKYKYKSSIMLLLVALIFHLCFCHINPLLGINLTDKKYNKRFYLYFFSVWTNLMMYDSVRDENGSLLVKGKKSDSF